MGVAIGTMLGLAIGVLGFIVMRDPMKLSLLAPGEEGYYQRMVLDRWPRISLRIMGVLGSLFGMVILSAALGAVPKLRVLKAVSNGLLVELGLLFCSVWLFGVLAAVAQAIRGNFSDWFWKRRQAIVLGPIAVYPPITPEMAKESRAFTVAFCVLVGIAACAAAYRR